MNGRSDVKKAVLQVLRRYHCYHLLPPVRCSLKNTKTLIHRDNITAVTAVTAVTGDFGMTGKEYSSPTVSDECKVL